MSWWKKVWQRHRTSWHFSASLCILQLEFELNKKSLELWNLQCWPCMDDFKSHVCWILWLRHATLNTQEVTKKHQVPVCLILAAAHHDKRQLVWLCDCVMIFPVLLKILAHVKHGCFLYLHSLNLCNRTLNDWFNKAKVISMSKSAVANGSAGWAC